MALTSLPVGSLTFTATAYPTTNGTGEAQARAVVIRTGSAGETLTVDLEMASTIDRMEITADDTTLLLNTTRQYVATAKSATGAVILTWSGNIQWSTSAAQVATVGQNGTVTAISAGAVTISVRAIRVCDQPAWAKAYARNRRASRTA